MLYAKTQGANASHGLAPEQKMFREWTEAM